MSIDHGSREPGEPARVRPTGDPLQMTEAEKRAAEWEARHDVAARGHRPGAETVQHYVAHERMTHPAPPHRAGEPVLTPAQPDVPPVQPTRQPRSRSWWRRLFHRGH